MKQNVLNTKGENVKEITLEKELFQIEPNDKVLKDAIIKDRCSLRQGTAKTKTRAEVSGGGRKPWRQKGTGNARQGSIRAVQWVGGGIAFGPVPRDYSKKQNKKEAKLALKSAISYKVTNKDLIVVDKINLATPKTKEITEMLKTLDIATKKVIFVVNEYDENVILATRNLRNLAVVLPTELGVLDIVSADKLLVEEEALNKMKEVLK